MPVPVADHFGQQAAACGELGSLFTASLCRLLAERLDRSTSFGRRILDWPGDPRADALALRACGALHALSRSGRDARLRRIYPPAAFDRERVWSAVASALTRHDDFLAAYLESSPQTNEVARSAMILGAALTVASLTRLPLALLEVGASAGLNLGFDRYRYEFGGGRFWGPAGSPLTIGCDWRGDLPPLDAPLQVVSRQGCDRAPLDPAAEVAAARLMSYFWPDQPLRLARLDAALKLAAASGQKIVRADAGAWVEHELGQPAVPGTCRFLFHTVVWQYLPADVRARIETVLATAGAAATVRTPLARFGFEADGKENGGAMILTLWPGERTIPLGRADFHGRWADWLRT